MYVIHSSNSVYVAIGQVWQCKQDSRGVVVLRIGTGFVLIRSMGTGRKSRVQLDQFVRRYRYVAESVQADMEGK